MCAMNRALGTRSLALVTVHHHAHDATSGETGTDQKNAVADELGDSPGVRLSILRSGL